MLLHRKNDSRDARSRSLEAIGRDPAAMFAGSRSMRNRKLGAARMRSSPRWMPASKLAVGPAVLVEPEQRLRRRCR